MSSHWSDRQSVANPEDGRSPKSTRRVPRWSPNGLRRDGIAEEIEKASLNKYKMTQGDLAKADQLIKQNAEFQMRCASFTPKPTAA